MENKFLFNDSIIVRFISLFVIGAILFTVVWHLSYHFLPEGIMQGKTGSAIIVGSDAAPTMLEEWGTIVLWNLLVLLLIALINLIRYLDRIPLGCITPLGLIALYAVFLGTNSFSIPMAEPMSPTLAVLGRGGPYEMTAYILVAVATYNQSRFALTNNSYHQSGSTIVVRTMGRNWACSCIDTPCRMAWSSYDYDVVESAN